MIKKEYGYNDIIPKSFYIGGRKINVRFSDVVGSGRYSGIAKHVVGQIILSTKVPDGDSIVNVSEDYLNQTFYHELVHNILLAMGEEELNQNEQFVDLFSVFLHQFIVTKKK